MPYLVDTNLLVRSADPADVQFDIAVQAISNIRQTDTLHITPQNLIEFWAVATRDRENNGLGFTLSRADGELTRLLGLFDLLEDHASVFSEWRRLVVRYGVVGVNVHDCRLVAAMLVHRIPDLLTFNIRHFRRYSEIRSVDATDAAAGNY